MWCWFHSHGGRALISFKVCLALDSVSFKTLFVCFSVSVPLFYFVPYLKKSSSLLFHSVNKAPFWCVCQIPLVTMKSSWVPSVCYSLCFFEFAWWSFTFLMTLSLCCIVVVYALVLCWYCSVAKLHTTLYDPMDHSTPAFSFFHCLLELAQIHVVWVGDAV